MGQDPKSLRTFQTETTQEIRYLDAAVGTISLRSFTVPKAEAPRTSTPSRTLALMFAV